jgi:hypothetical protein
MKTSESNISLKTVVILLLVVICGLYLLPIYMLIIISPYIINIIYLLFEMLYNKTKQTFILIISTINMYI